jgi:DNA-binding MarR family transcriptional regulator
MEDNVAFLCVDVARLFRKHFADMAREVGGTGAQWRALIVVRRFPGISQGALADRLDVEPITTCRLMDRMEQAGLVERRRDPNDRRVWQLFLTEEARPVSLVMEQIGQAMLERATNGLTPEELNILRGLLVRMRDNIAEGDDTPKETAHG